MLRSLPRVRSVVEISYGCMGFSVRQASTARASGFETRRRVMTPPPVRLLESEYSECPYRQDPPRRPGAGDAESGGQLGGQRARVDDGEAADAPVQDDVQPAQAGPEVGLVVRDLRRLDDHDAVVLQALRRRRRQHGDAWRELVVVRARAGDGVLDARVRQGAGGTPHPAVG